MIMLLRVYKFERIKTLFYCNLYIIDRIKVEWGEEKKKNNEKDKFTVEIKKNGLLLTFTYCEIFYILAGQNWPLPFSGKINKILSPFPT